MKAKVSVLAKPHSYIFFTLQLDSAWKLLGNTYLYNWCNAYVARSYAPRPCTITSLYWQWHSIHASCIT